jgi:hypothetical protein
MEILSGGIGMATQKREIVAIFENRHEADQAKQTIQNSGIDGRKVMIDDHVEPYTQVAAMGTTVGGEAGLLLGAFYGGVVGVIAVVIASVWTTGHYTVSRPEQLAVIGFAIAGAVLGSLSGKGLRRMQPAGQKIKGNPDAPRRFRLMVQGSTNEVLQAQKALGQPVG